MLHVDFDAMPTFLDHSDRVRDLGGDAHAAEAAAMEDAAKLQAFLSSLVCLVMRCHCCCFSFMYTAATDWYGYDLAARITPREIHLPAQLC